MASEASGASGLHGKILDNMDAEAKAIESDLEIMEAPKNKQVKKIGFFARLKKIFSRNRV